MLVCLQIKKENQTYPLFYPIDGGPRSAGWRDHGSGDGRRRKFDFDFRDGEGGRRRTGSEGGEEERDGLPEWCTDEEEGEMGTFDSSGAFMCIKVCMRLRIFLQKHCGM